MNDKIKHRGPNDEGYVFWGEVEKETISNALFYPFQNASCSAVFAHRRLSVIDLTNAGHQPMHYLDRYWIVFNGEIYNYVELKEELKTHGYTFASSTDTEVILAAYDFWGIDCQKKFNGMWAIAIFDTKTNEIFLSRDRFGVKPLYYYQDENQFVFASEIKAILANENVKSGPNLAYCKDYMKIGAMEYIKETAFENIHRFNFSSFVKMPMTEIFKPFQEGKFWDFEINTAYEKYNDQKAKKIAEDYYTLLKDAVKVRLRTDVPYGSSLSGGLDSSSISFLIEELTASSKSEHRQKSFSTVHSGANKDIDESYYIKLIANMLNIESKTIEPSVNEVPELHKKVIYHWESPLEGLGMSGINTYKLIHEHGVIVTLDGQGADEQQAGYEFYIINHLMNLPLLVAFKEAFHLSKNMPKLYRGIYKGTILKTMSVLIGKNGVIGFGKKFLNKDLTYIFTPLNQILKEDIHTNLINLIHYSDSRSMMYGIESRMPFMDYRLVEFTAKIPAVYKIHNGWTKHFARQAFQDRLPAEICWRKDKLGWPVPTKNWLSGELKNWFLNEINSSQFLKSIIGNESLAHSELNEASAVRKINLSVWHKVFFS